MQSSEQCQFSRKCYHGPICQCCTGLGWVAVGVKGPADLKLWVHKGVGVTTHASILPDYAQALERPGFSNSNLKQVDKSRAKSGSK